MCKSLTYTRTHTVVKIFNAITLRVLFVTMIATIGRVRVAR